MILLHKLSGQFSNCSILTLNSKVKVTKQIEIDELVFFVDNENRVHSINIFDERVLNFSKNKPFQSISGILEKKLIDNFSKKYSQFKFESSKKFVYGEILSRNIHPKSDKLFVLEIDIKSKKIQIVTNTLDSQVGKTVVLGLEGSITASGMNILNGKILDIDSHGMLISYQTLGFAKKGLIFGEKIQVGKDFEF
ncbi:TyrS-associated PheT N-terminal domain-related protein TapR [Mycoplasmopsis cricetuli]|uniref:TyrS-associated PheT N-terminal domain-related protein TapR n=1 Tax=Mycoplasmopsis cricetuli TaxID=171283 RepID=UPI000472C18E|nr:hypothetical protein [Mycoplasmopsis cricetuli]